MTPGRGVARVALATAVLALAVAVAGVGPADAVKAVKRALNADAVDGLSASKTPQHGKLLALGRNGRFPPAALPNSVRGPRGPVGPTGPSGAAEAYIDRNDAINQLPTAAATTAIAELRLPAGAYTLDFAAHTYLSDGNSTFVDCQLTANGQRVVKSAVHVGGAAAATIEAQISMIEAVNLPDATVVRALCSERSDTNVRLTDARLRASRVTSVVGQ